MLEKTNKETKKQAHFRFIQEIFNIEVSSILFESLYSRLIEINGLRSF